MKQRQCLPSSVKYNIFTKLKQAKKKKKSARKLFTAQKNIWAYIKENDKTELQIFYGKEVFFFQKNYS